MRIPAWWRIPMGAGCPHWEHWTFNICTSEFAIRNRDKIWSTNTGPWVLHWKAPVQKITEVNKSSLATLWVVASRVSKLTSMFPNSANHSCYFSVFGSRLFKTITAIFVLTYSCQFSFCLILHLQLCGFLFLEYYFC